MRKYLFYLLISCLPFLGKAQLLSEGFEGATFPPTGWTTFVGMNGLGNAVAQNWSAITTLSPHGGTKHAYVRYSTATGSMSEDWMVTPAINLSDYENAEMTFWTKQQYTDVYNNTYTIKVSTTSQTDHASFTNVASWDETTIGVAGIYEQKTVDLSAYDGNATVYVAFVMANDDGDNWFVDDIVINADEAVAEPEGCLTAIEGQWPANVITPTCNGLYQTFLTNAYASEFSKVNVTAGNSYTFRSSVATDFITISNEAGTVVYAAGTGPLTWTATSTEVVRYYLHANAECGAQATNRVKGVACGVVPDEPEFTCDQSYSGVFNLASNITSSGNFAVANDFFVPMDADAFKLQKVTFLIVINSPTSAATDFGTFDLSILSDNASAPGAIVESFEDLTASNVTLHTETFATLKTFYVTFDLPDGGYEIPVNSAADTRYWLSVTGVVTTGSPMFLVGQQRYDSWVSAPNYSSSDLGTTWVQVTGNGGNPLGTFDSNWSIDADCTAPVSECDAVNVPYTEDFQTAVVPAAPECTTFENAGSGNNWITATAATGNYGFTGTFLRYSYNEDNNANAWFYTRGINLEADKTYKISYKYGGTFALYPESLKVAYGTSAQSSAMTTQLADHPTVTNDPPLVNEVEFSPDTDGVYYFGFNAYSEADMFYLHVDDIKVEEVEETTDPEYCVPVINCEDDDVITNVTFAGINNTSACSPNGYGDYTAGAAATVEAGNSYPISVTVGAGWYERVSVWIDFNNDGVFDAADFIGEIGDGGTGVTVTEDIAIPVGQAEGSYRMRVLAFASGSDEPASEDPCINSLGQYGEYEDYTINVTTGGGEPGEDCSQEFTGAIFNGVGIVNNGTTLQYIGANDINVDANSTFTLEKVTLQIVTLGGQPTTVNLSIYENGTGPGVLKQSFANLVPTSITDIGAFGTTAYRVYSVVLDLPTAQVLEGGTSGAKYWVGVGGAPSTTAANVFWVSYIYTTSSTSMPTYQSTNNGTAWAEFVDTASGNKVEGIMLVEGTCETTEEPPADGCLEANEDLPQWPTSTFTPNCNGEATAIATNCWTGEYSKVQVTAGTEYIFSSSVASDFITISDENGTVVYTAGTGPITWTATASGVVRFYLHLDDECDFGDQINRSRIIQCGEFVPPTGYCEPFLDCTDGDLITNVTFAGINNTTTCSPDGYGNYTDGQMAYVEAGSTNPISVTVGSGFSSESVSVWIDYNNNFIFEDNEFTYVGTGSGSEVLGNIAIPAGTPDGEYRMRVRVAAVGSALATSDLACDEEQVYGETEDYIVNVGELGITNLNSFDFSYYPNPVKDVLNISAKKNVENVSVFNLAGQKVVNNAKVSNGQINVSALNPGTYVFRVTLEGGQVETFKVIKK